MSNRSPLTNQNVHLYAGFTPPMVSSCIRDVLRFLFSLSELEGLKYSLEDEKDRDIAVDLAFEENQEGPVQKVPKVAISRGAYSTTPVGLTDSMYQTNYASYGQKDSTVYLNMVNGSIEISVKAWNLGVCERLAYYTSIFLVWSRPHLCSTLGFRNLANAINVSPPMPDRDDKECFVIRIEIPYSTEMKWADRDVGTKIKDFILNIESS